MNNNKFLAKLCVDMKSGLCPKPPVSYTHLDVYKRQPQFIYL